MQPYMAHYRGDCRLNATKVAPSMACTTRRELRRIQRKGARRLGAQDVVARVGEMRDQEAEDQVLRALEEAGHDIHNWDDYLASWDDDEIDFEREDEFWVIRESLDYCDYD